MSANYTTTVSTTALAAGVVVYTPNNSLSNTITLQSTGNSAIKKTGTLNKNGSYTFVGVDDGKYKLYEDIACTVEITSWAGGQTDGKWIGDDNMEVYEQAGTCVKLAGGNSISGGNAFVSSAPVSYYAPTTTDQLTRKDYVDGAIATAISAIGSGITLSSNNIWVGYNIFNTRTKLYGGTAVNGGNWFFGRNDFLDQAPYSNFMPINNAQLTNKWYVDENIKNSISSITTGLSATYQQSQNIIRLVPNGIQETNRLYTSWGQAVYNATTRSLSSTKQFTIEIEGNGTGSNTIIMQSHDPINSFPAYADYVHFKAYGSNVLVTTAIGSQSESLSASAIGRIVVDGYTFQDPGGDGWIDKWYNIIFRNCKFISHYDAYYGTWAKHHFYNCITEGGNEFIGGDSSSYAFDNVSGERIYIEQTPTISGTNKIQYYTSTKMSIGTIELTGTGTTLQIDKNISVSGTTISTQSGTLHLGATTTIEGDLNINEINISADGGELTISSPVSIPSDLKLTGFGFVAPDKASDTISETYGMAQDGRACGTPDHWLNITIDGNVYAIPCYTPKA